MFLDATLGPLLPGTPQSMVAGVGVNLQIGNIVDLLGLGAGISPAAANITIGNVSTWGTDFGIGMDKMQLEAVVGTAFATATSCTLDVWFELAPDNGSAQPGTWQPVATTGPLTAAQLTANTIFARFDYPPAFPANLSPRFMRLLGVVPSAANFTAGTISYAIIVPSRDDSAQRFAAENYTAQNFR